MVNFPQDYRELLEALSHCRPLVTDHASRTTLIARVTSCKDSIRAFHRRHPDLPPDEHRFLRAAERDLDRLRRAHLRVDRGA
jgi:hypothetical protein